MSTVRSLYNYIFNSTEEKYMSHPFGVSIISTAGLVGLIDFFFRRGGVYRAVVKANVYTFGIQLMPLSTLWLSRARFEKLLYSMKELGANVLSYENRWGGDDPYHSWKKDLPDGKFSAMLAYCLLFPLRYREVEARLALIRKYFPNAIAVDLPKGLWELSLHNNSIEGWVMYLHTPEALFTGIVLDTFHLMELSEDEIGFGIIDTMLAKIAECQVPIKLLQVQFRDSTELSEFLSQQHCATSHILVEIRKKKLLADGVPIIIELTPNIATKENLTRIRKEITALLKPDS
jgi:hypothetical protein